MGHSTTITLGFRNSAQNLEQKEFYIPLTLKQCYPPRDSMQKPWLINSPSEQQQDQGTKQTRSQTKEGQVPWDSPLSSATLEAYDSPLPQEEGVKLGVGGSEGKYPYYLPNTVKTPKYLFVDQEGY